MAPYAVGMLATTPTPRSVTGLVDAFWNSDVGARCAIQRVLPDGCIDFVFDLVSGSARVVGPMQTAQLVELDAGASLFGVRFLPGTASAFLDVEASALLDLEPPLAELTRAGRERLAERVAEARDHSERAQLVANFLCTAGNARRSLDARVQRATALIASAAFDPSARMARIASSVGVGERQLERLFRERVGLRPKHYARIVRLTGALKLARAGYGSQAELAARAGYADESHLLRDFRELTGVTLNALRAEEMQAMSDSSKAPHSAEARSEP